MKKQLPQSKNQDTWVLAKEMGRSHSSVHAKINRLPRMATFKKGKVTFDEINRTCQAVANEEDYKLVAKELGRDETTVHGRMQMIISNPNSQNKTRAYSLEEDFLI